METRELRQTILFSASPEQVYKAIMDSAIHSKFTGAAALIGEHKGDVYSAYDGYVTGVILDLEPYRRIMKTWIAHEEGWPEDHVSEVMFEFNPVDAGTEMNFVHTGIPEVKYDNIKQGWIDYYWEPMEEMFKKVKNGAMEQ
jgi:uncharacterized protein YndB with AHSA1/START domain